MALSKDDIAYHTQQVAEALESYIAAASNSPDSDAKTWNDFKRSARRSLKLALKETNCLREVSEGLQSSGRSALALRFLMAPPKSQDQLKLLCKSYSKGRENSGNPFDPKSAQVLAAVFSEWRDREATSWLSSNREPTRYDIRSLFTHAAPLIAYQKLQTKRRMDSSKFQEETIAEMLLDDRWKLLSSKKFGRNEGIAARHFMRKARIAAGARAKEIDIAIGLGNSFVMALECKVSNDGTNSTKRLNEISEKAEAWRSEYGRGLKTATLLQGVYNTEDVLDLADSGVEVFWFHDLPRLSRRIAEETVD